MDIDLYCDGASRGNPGPASVGIVVVDHDTDAVLAKTGKTIGEKTNNVAEYEAIKRGLTLAWKDYKANIVRVYSDSQLVISRNCWTMSKSSPSLSARSSTRKSPGNTRRFGLPTKKPTRHWTSERQEHRY